LNKIDKPFFFCIGAQKAGTTTLHDILTQNKEIALPSEKESHFFSAPELYEKGLEYYFNYFFDSSRLSDCLLAGEIDPSYSFFKGTAARINQNFERPQDLRFVFILRNPVARAYSHYLMSSRRGYEKLGFQEAIRQEKDRIKDPFGFIHFSYMSRGYYSEQIKEYLEYYAPTQFLYLRFEEDLMGDLEGSITAVEKFLGLSPYAYDLDLKSNAASVPRSQILRDLTHKEYYLKSLLARLIPSKKVRTKIKDAINKRNFKTSSTQRLDEMLMKQLYLKHFKEETRAIEALTGLDLSSWKT